MTPNVARPSAHKIVSGLRANSVLRKNGSGVSPTRPRSSRSESQQVWIARSGCVRLVRMTVTGPLQEPEPVIGQVDEAATKHRGELGGTRPMLRIRELVPSARVVEDGEELDHLEIGPGLGGQPAAVLQHSGPVGDAMIALPREGELLQDGVNDHRDARCHRLDS